MALMFIAVYKCEVLCFSAQVGCGVGNTIFPLLAEFPQIFLHACDFSPRAVNLVKVRILELYRNLPFLWNPSLVDLWYNYDLWNLILVQIRFCLKSHDRTLLCWQAHQEYSEQRVNAFVCDVTAEDLSAFIAPSSVDVVTLVHVLNKLLFLLLLSYCWLEGLGGLEVKL